MEEKKHSNLKKNRMKTKLLKKLRREGRNQIHIYRIRRNEFGTITGMGYGYNSEEYGGLFSYGDTPDEVRDKAMRIYITKRIAELKEKR